MANDTRVKVIPLSKGDLIQSTYHMDAAEFGAYFRLLLVHYDHPDGLPVDDKLLAKWAGCNAKVWNRVKPVVLEKFQRVESPGREPKLVQRRTVEEVQLIRERSLNQSANARKRWEGTDATASKSHQSGNATPSPSTKPQPEPEVKTPNPLPVDNVDNSPGKGAGALIKSEGGSSGGFRVFPLLSQAARNLAREKAPGWDILKLAQVYDDGINAGDRERPRNPSKAFPEWCARYTKGRPPG